MNLWKILKVSKGLPPTDYTSRLFPRKTGITAVTVSGVPCILENSVGKPVISYKIYGNSVQNGTPSPENPVEVKGVGKRTKNLCPKLNNLWKLVNHQYRTVSKIEDGVFEVLCVDVNNEDTAWKAGSVGIWLEAGEYILSFDVYSEQSNFYIQSNSRADNSLYATGLLCGTTFYGNADKSVPKNTWKRVSFSVYLPNADYYNVSLGGDKPNIIKNAAVKIKNVQLELGSSPTEYEPYGYEIPVVVKSGNNEVRTSIFLDNPLKTGDILKYPENILVHADGTSETVLLPEIPTFDGTTVIEVDTEIKPSDMEITYKSRRKTND